MGPTWAQAHVVSGAVEAVRGMQDRPHGERRGRHRCH